jgi:hypothetical protein
MTLDDEEHEVNWLGGNGLHVVDGEIRRFPLKDFRDGLTLDDEKYLPSRRLPFQQPERLYL